MFIYIIEKPKLKYFVLYEIINLFLVKIISEKHTQWILEKVRRKKEAQAVSLNYPQIEKKKNNTEKLISKI